MDIRCPLWRIGHFDKKISRGILQGDSISPLLFALCMNPLSRKLNGGFASVAVRGNDADKEQHALNQLLFIDDLKLLADQDAELRRMMDETKCFFGAVE